METLVDLLGKLVDSPQVKLIAAKERLIASSEPDLQEGEPIRSYLSSPDLSYQLMHIEGTITTLFVFVQETNENAAFQGELVAGFTRHSKRDDVVGRLGKPSRSGEPTDVPILGRQGAWDRYDSTDVCTHFSFTEHQAVLRLITVMLAGTIPQ